MLEERKQKEKNHYNKKVEEIINKDYLGFDWQYGSKKHGPILSISSGITEEKIKEIIHKRRKEGREVYFASDGELTEI